VVDIAQVFALGQLASVGSDQRPPWPGGASVDTTPEGRPPLEQPPEAEAQTEFSLGHEVDQVVGKDTSAHRTSTTGDATASGPASLPPTVGVVFDDLVEGHHHQGTNGHGRQHRAATLAPTPILLFRTSPRRGRSDPLRSPFR
jgi:hypothetical protein